MKYTNNIVSTWFSNKVCMLFHSTAVLSGLHNSTSAGSSNACDATMHEEHMDLWQCEAAAARPGAGSMLAKAVVAVCCTMYRAAVVLFDLVLAFCVFNETLEFVQSFRNISVYGRRFSQGSCSGEFWKNEN